MCVVWYVGVCSLVGYEDLLAMNWLARARRNQSVCGRTDARQAQQEGKGESGGAIYLRRYAQYTIIIGSDLGGNGFAERIQS